MGQNLQYLYIMPENEYYFASNGDEVEKQLQLSKNDSKFFTLMYSNSQNNEYCLGREMGVLYKIYKVKDCHSGGHFPLRVIPG